MVEKLLFSLSVLLNRAVRFLCLDLTQECLSWNVISSVKMFEIRLLYILCLEINPGIHCGGTWMSSTVQDLIPNVVCD